MKKYIVTLALLSCAVSAALNAGTFSFINHTAQDRRVKLQLQGVMEPTEDLGIAKANGGSVGRTFDEFLRRGLCIGKVEISEGGTEDMVRKVVVGVGQATYDEIMQNLKSPETIKAIMNVAGKKNLFAVDGGIGVCPDRKMHIVPTLNNSGKETCIVIIRFVL